ncbi:MAG: efflux RND transporter periplasmic adaptor subunit, partial [Candidatus Rokuibacteriota bacterium]
METSELLRELRIDRDGRPPRLRRRRLLLAAAALVVLAAGLWLAWART